MTKPATLPRWATNLTNNDAPSSGQMDTGWTPGQDGVSDYDNYIKYWSYQWLKWIDDGCPGTFTANDLIVTGATTFTGTATKALTADVTDLDPASTSVHTLYINPNVDGWTISGMVGGVDGREIDIIGIGTKNFKISHGFGGAGNAIKFPSQYVQNNGIIIITAGGRLKLRYIGSLSCWYVISMTGCLYRTYESVPIAAAYHTGGTRIQNTITSNTVVSIQYPINLPPGSILDEWRLYVNKISNGAVTVGGGVGKSSSTSSAIVPVNGAGAGTTNVSSANAPGYITLYDVSLNETIPHAGSIPSTTNQYFLDISCSAGGSDVFMHADIFGWVPV